jgi:hypothetical protein
MRGWVKTETTRVYAKVAISGETNLLLLCSAKGFEILTLPTELAKEFLKQKKLSLLLKDTP